MLGPLDWTVASPFIIRVLPTRIILFLISSSHKNCVSFAYQVPQQNRSVFLEVFYDFHFLCDLIIQMMHRTSKKRECLIGVLTRLLAETVLLLRQFPFVSTLTAALEIILFSFALIEPNLSLFAWASQARDMILGGGQLSLVIFWLYNGLTIMVLLTLIILLAVKLTSRSLNKFFSAAYVFLQVTMLLYQFNALAILQQKSVIFAYTFYFLLLPITLFLIESRLDLHLFGKMAIPLAAARIFLPFDIWKAVLLAFTFRYYFSATTIQQKYGYVALALVQLWGFCYQQISHLLVLVYPFLTLLIALLVAINFKQSLLPESKNDYLLKLVSKAKSKTKNASEDVQLSMAEKIEVITIIESSKIKPSPHFFLNVGALKDDILKNKAKIKDILNLIEMISDDSDEKWVKAEVEIEKDSNVLRMYKMIGQLEADGLDQAIRLQILKLKAQKCSQLKFGDNLDIKIVQDVNLALQSFYQSLYLCVKQLVNFWQVVQGPNVCCATLTQKLEQILWHKEKARQQLKAINKVHPSKQESHLLMQVQRLINSYQQNSSSESKSILAVRQSKCTYNYMLVEEDEIKQISSKLLVDLGLSKESRYTLHERDVIVPRLIDIIYEQYEQYTKEEFYLPLVVHQKLIVKKATIHMVPLYTSALQHLIVVEPTPIRQAFLYDVENDEILYFTRKRSPGTQECASFELIKSIPKTIFNLDLNKEHLQTLRKGFHLNSELNQQFTRCFFPPEAAATDICKANLTLVAEYQNKQSHFMLIEMKLSSSIQSFDTRLTPKKRKIREDSIDKSDRIKQFEKEPRFCKIHNPYRQNIREKIQNHKRNKAVTYTTWISLLGALLVMAAIAGLIAGLVLARNRNQQYAMYLQEGKDLNEEYENLMKIYYDSHIRYYLKKYPEETLKWNPSYNVQQGIDFYTDSINSTINVIMIQEYANPLQSQKVEIDYVYKYDLFNISVTSLHNDIVGLLQETKKYLTTYNITFLVNNYDQIRKIDQSYRVSSSVAKHITEYPSSNFLVVQLMLSIIALLTLLVYIVLGHFKRVIDRIYSYIPCIKAEQHAEALDNIQRLFQSYPILLHFDSLNQGRCIEALELGSIQIGKAPQREKKINNESLGMFLAKNYVYGVLLLLMLGAGVGYQVYVNNQTENLGLIMAYMEDMQVSSDFVLTEITDALNAMVWKDLFNTTNIYDLKHTLTIKTHMDSPLPTYFNAYQHYQMEQLYKDLCITSGRLSKIRFFDGVECSSMFDGSLLNGYSIVYESYRNSLTQLRQLTLKDMLNFKRTNAKYPLFIEASYSRRLITGLIGDLIAQFVFTSKDYCNYLLDQTTAFIQVTLALVVVLGVCLALGIRSLKKRCQLALAMVRIIPKDTLGDVKLTKQMIKNDFLGSLEHL